MKWFLICSLMILTSCATSPSKTQVKGDEEVMVIPLPPVPKDNIARSPFFNTQKQVITNRNGFVYEFYYGSGGRYIVVVKPPAGVFFDFAGAEGTLTVTEETPRGELNPEIISLSVDRKGILMGSGDPRSGEIKVSLQVFVPSSKYNGSLNDEVYFSMKILDHF